MRAKITAYETNGAIISRITHGDYYSVQSTVDESLMYVFGSDEVAVVTGSLAIRIPCELFGEIADIAEDMKDLRRRKIL